MSETGTDEARMPTQKRALRTRESLLEAAQECLVRFGYAETTLTRILETAHVSRGSLLHQFTTKDQLLVSAAKSFADKHRDHLERTIVDTTEGGIGIDAAIEVSWATYHGQYFVATMELWIAARTNPPLKRALQSDAKLVGELNRRLIDRFFGKDFIELDGYEEFVKSLQHSMYGRAVTYFFRDSDYRVDSMVPLWKELARQHRDQDHGRGR